MVIRHRSDGTAATRSRQTNYRMYENFRPTFERKEEEATYIITLRLPGFVKEQIRITSGYNPRMVRIQGERSILSNKRSRFNQEITVPEMCDLDKIHSKFQNGILTIIIPKDVPPKLLTPEEVSKTIQKTTPSITSKATADQPTKQTERQKVDQKTTSDQTKVHMGKENETVQNAKIEPKSKKVEDKAPLKQEIPSTSKAPELPKLQKVQDNSVSTKPMLIKAGADKQKDEKSAIVSSIAQKPSADQLKIQTAGREEAFVLSFV